MRRRLAPLVVALGALGCASGGATTPSDVNVVLERSAVDGCEYKGLLTYRGLYIAPERLDPVLVQQVVARGGNTLLVADQTVSQRFDATAQIYDCPKETIRAEPR